MSLKSPTRGGREEAAGVYASTDARLTSGATYVIMLDINHLPPGVAHPCGSEVDPDGVQREVWLFRGVTYLVRGGAEMRREWLSLLMPPLNI